MGKFFEALKKGIVAAGDAMGEESKPHRFVAAGKPIRCLHCKGELFLKSDTVQLDRNHLSRSEWDNERVSVLACTGCGRLEWFALAPERR
jgi:hypothetical protein